MIFYKEVEGKGCGLMEAPNLEAAKKQLLREEGSSNGQLVRKATKDDIGWVEGMGGGILKKY